MSHTTTSVPVTLEWVGDVDGHLRLIDQTLLPTELRYLDCFDTPTVWEAIKMLRVRGAPAIGVAAAYGMCVAIRRTDVGTTHAEAMAQLREARDYLAGSRPTAVNLFWALDRMWNFALGLGETIDAASLQRELLAEARRIHTEDQAMCRAIGRHGAPLLADGCGVLTHCNAGGLATSEYGTALAPMFAAHETGKKIHVFADETRPLLQGARLTAWECAMRGIDVTLICDSMAAQVMREGRIQSVIVGADRIAANGDTANKIGTYSVAVLARAHGIPFYVAAPSSTFDLKIASGAEIPIEIRDPSEISHGFGRQTSPAGIQIYNPAFDVTPAELITAIICEKGVISPVSTTTITGLLSGA